MREDDRLVFEPIGALDEILKMQVVVPVRTIHVLRSEERTFDQQHARGIEHRGGVEDRRGAVPGVCEQWNLLAAGDFETAGPDRGDLLARAIQELLAELVPDFREEVSDRWDTVPAREDPELEISSKRNRLA